MIKDIGTMPALQRGFRVLDILVEAAKECSFGYIQKECDNLPAPTLSRLLKAMQAQELVEKDSVSGLYSAGEAFMQLAQKAAGSVPREARLQPLLDSIAKETGHSTAYFEPDGNELVLMAKCDQDDSFRYIDVYAHSIHFAWHSFGQLILAYFDEKKQKSILASVKHKPHMPMREFRKHLTEVKKQGYFAGLDGCNRSLLRVVVPVFAGEGGEFAGALGITILERDMPKSELEKIIQRMRDAGKNASRLIS